MQSMTLRKKTWAAGATLVVLTQLAGMIAATAAVARDRDDRRFDHAWRTETVSSREFVIFEGETDSVDLGSWRMVKSIFVQAEGIASNGSSTGTFEVWANGEMKGTVEVPVRDPSYLVTIGETVKSIEFRHIAGARVRVKSVKAVQRAPHRNPYDDRWPDSGYGDDGGDDIWIPEDPRSSLPASNRATAIARRAIDLVERLDGYSDYQELGQFLLPIKKAAADAYAAASVRGDLSRRVHKKLYKLLQQVLAADDFVDNMYERGRAFELAVQLKALGEQIADCLH